MELCDASIEAKICWCLNYRRQCYYFPFIVFLQYIINDGYNWKWKCGWEWPTKWSFQSAGAPLSWFCFCSGTASEAPANILWRAGSSSGECVWAEAVLVLSRKDSTSKHYQPHSSAGESLVPEPSAEGEGVYVSQASGQVPRYVV